MRTRLLLLMVLVLGWTVAANASEVSEMVDQLQLRRYFIEAGTDVSIDDMERLVAAYPQVSFVALASETESGADALAADLLSELGEGTIVVRTPTEIGAISSEYDDDALNQALDDVIATRGDGYVTDFEEFASAVAAVPAAKSGGVPVGLIIMVIVGGVVAYVVWNGRRRRIARGTERLEEARTEIRSQTEVVANQILKMADDPRFDEHSGAREHYRAASQIFESAEARAEAALDLIALEKLSDDLDQARWELEAATALVEGRDPPAKPADEKPPHCFFDPTHGAGTERAELATAAGNQSVWVCQADAEKLRRGEAPQPRTIPMGTSQVPAPRAPRSHGGLGLDWLDVFSVVVGGMGSGIPYDWGGQRPPGRRFPGGGRSLPRPSGGHEVKQVRPKGRARRRL